MMVHGSKQALPPSLLVLWLFAALTFAWVVGCSNDDNGAGPNNPATTVTDIDGNVYQTVKIGDQWWMAENLKVTHYRNGDSIVNVTDSATWVDLTSGAWGIYDHDTANVATYGRLYNWFTVGDSRGLAPAGWHVPTDDEWKQLEMFLGMTQEQADSAGWRGSDEGGKLKEAGVDHWNLPNEGATDEVGFCAMPGGMQHINSHFQSLQVDDYFWTATGSGDYAWLRSLNCDRSTIFRYNDYKNYGFSIRCVKD